MSIKEPFATQTVEGNTQFTLSAEAGESLLVRGIKIYNPSASYLTLAVEKTTVGYYRIGGDLGNHLFFPRTDLQIPNLLAVMIANGWMDGYPIAEGEQMTFTGVHQANAIATVDYIIADAGDFKRDAPNGSAARNYLYMSYGRYSTTLEDGDNVYVTPQTPVEFPAFPFGAVVPAQTQIELLGIAASTVGVTSNSQSKQHESQYIKLVRERATLFDQSRDGMLNRGDADTGTDENNYGTGWGLFGNNSDVDLRPIFTLPEPLVFSGGEELIVNFHTEVVAGTKNISPVRSEVGMIQRVSKQ